MAPRTPRQRLQIVIGNFFLLVGSLEAYHLLHGDTHLWLDYIAAPLQLMGALMMLWFGFSSKERP